MLPSYRRFEKNLKKMQDFLPDFISDTQEKLDAFQSIMERYKNIPKQKLKQNLAKLKRLKKYSEYISRFKF